MCKRYIDQLPPVASCGPPAGDLGCNPGMCSDLESNQELLVHRSALNPLSHTSQGKISFITVYLHAIRRCYIASFPLLSPHPQDPI